MCAIIKLIVYYAMCGLNIYSIVSVAAFTFACMGSAKSHAITYGGLVLCARIFENKF